MIRLLSKIEKEVPRIHKEHWISFVYDLNAVLPARRNTADDLHIRRATEKDIEIISGLDENKEPVIASSLRFWNDHGFRGLYLGFLNDDRDPAIFQYVIDDADNERYASMEYGNMYHRQSGDSVQVENIYAFSSRRRNHLAIDFETRLFELLKQAGKKKGADPHQRQEQARALLGKTGRFPARLPDNDGHDQPALLQNAEKKIRFFQDPRN